MPPRTAPNPTNLDDSDGEHSERLPRKNSKSTACQPYSVPAVIWSRRTISLVLDHAQYELKGVAHERGDFLDGLDLDLRCSLASFVRIGIILKMARLGRRNGLIEGLDFNQDFPDDLKV